MLAAEREAALHDVVMQALAYGLERMKGEGRVTRG